MEREKFDALQVIRLEWEGENGSAELCRGRDGTDWVRLRLVPEDCQREFLAALGRTAPARLEDGALELLLPWAEGVPLDQWLYERVPDLGQRRNACLSLLAGLLGGGWPPCLTALSAREKNLCFTEGGCALRPLPDLDGWRPGMAQGEAARAVTGLVCQIMTQGMDTLSRRRQPPELQLLCRREQEGGCASWEQLQRCVAAIPDRLPPLGEAVRAAAGRIAGRLRRWGRWAAPVLTALLAVAAALSLAAALRGWRQERRDVWPGITQIGDQRLVEQEGEEG